jgi:hypothetical protein
MLNSTRASVITALVLAEASAADMFLAREASASATTTSSVVTFLLVAEAPASDAATLLAADEPKI